MSDEYSNLKPWKIPSDYGGKYWFGWYPVYGQHRDSDRLTRSNYKRILEELSKLDAPLLAEHIDPRNEDEDFGEHEGDPTVTDAHEGHWAVGWVETILVHSSNKAACKAADEILSALEDYPIFDEYDYSELESDETQKWWDSMSTRDRIDECIRAECSIFVARRESISELPDRLLEIIQREY
jgi:hypothetical protein